MQKQGKVVQINLSMMAKSQAGKEYPAWQLIFSTPDGKVENLTKHRNSLKFNSSLAASLNSLAVGDDIVVTLEKKGDFWEVESITKGTGNTSIPTGGTATPTKITGSNYETKEERALRQRLIVRQSSLSSAIAFFEKAKAAPSVEEVIGVAERFTEYVFEDKQDAMIKPQGEIE